MKEKKNYIILNFSRALYELPTNISNICIFIVTMISHDYETYMQ